VGTMESSIVGEGNYPFIEELVAGVQAELTSRSVASRTSSGLATGTAHPPRVTGAWGRDHTFGGGDQVPFPHSLKVISNAQRGDAHRCDYCLGMDDYVVFFAASPDVTLCWN
jgi:hypothetical protein